MILPALTKNPFTISNIVDKSCIYFEIDLPYLRKKLRDNRRVAIRQMVFRCLRVEYKKTFTSIAEHFDMDHTTIIHSINKLDDLMSVYPELLEDYIKYITNLKNLLDQWQH